MMFASCGFAQYVPKRALQFDLCIIDEASQMPPEISNRRATEMQSGRRRWRHKPAAAEQLLQDALLMTTRLTRMKWF